MADSQMNKLVTGFVFLIIAVIFVGILAGSNVDTWSKTIVTDEAIDISTARLTGEGYELNTSITFEIANLPASYKSELCPITVVTYGNASGDFTVTTDYTISATTGVLTLKNTTTVNTSPNETVIDYTYCSDNYLTLGWDRTMITTTYGLFALGAFGIALWFFYSIFKETGLA